MPEFTVRTFSDRAGRQRWYDENVRNLHERMRTNRHCTGLYLEHWILGSLASGTGKTTLFVAYDAADPKFPLAGIAGVEVRSDSMHVEVLCSWIKGAGRKLMREVELAAYLLGKKAVDLVSVPRAAGFYRKIGFVRGPYGVSPARRNAARKRFKATFPRDPGNAWQKEYYLSDPNERRDYLPKYHKRVR